MKLTLIRHTSVAIAPGICYGQSDVDVTDSFESEAKLVQDKLLDKNFDAVFSSPLQRCTKLADFCGYAQLIIDNSLLELNFGAWELEVWDEIQDPHLNVYFENWIDRSPTHGESFRDMVARVSRFLEELKSKPYENIAIFTHGGVIRAIWLIINGIDIENAFDLEVGYGEVLEVELI
jgi:alpha-ribazole phosphatase